MSADAPTSSCPLRHLASLVSWHLQRCADDVRTDDTGTVQYLFLRHWAELELTRDRLMVKGNQAARAIARSWLIAEGYRVRGGNHDGHRVVVVEGRR